MSDKITLGDFIGKNMDEDFLEFDLTEIQEILKNLKNTDAIDLAHAEHLAQITLRGADILIEFSSKIVKITTYLESKINSKKNEASLNYEPPTGVKANVDMRMWAGNCAPEVEKLNILLAKAKGAKVAIEKKFDIMIKAHHQYKDIATGLRRTILGFDPPAPKAEGWE